MRIFLDTSPLRNSHGGRGIGAYTRELERALRAEKNVTLVEKSSDADLVHYPFFDLFFPTLPTWNSGMSGRNKPVGERLSIKPKRIVTIHDVIPLQFRAHYPVGIRGWLNHFRQRWALRSIDVIITDSYASKASIIDFLHIQEERIVVIPLAATTNLQLPSLREQQRLIRQLHLPNEYILYVGDINYNKNIPQLIKSLRHLPDEIQLVCVGRNFTPQEIPEWEAIERQIALTDVPDRVHFLSTIQSNETGVLATIYSRARAYVQPSLSEGFGLPVLEALQVGTPVVSANTGSLPEVGGEAVLYAEPEAEALAAQVREVLEWSASERADVIKVGRAHAATFTWKLTAQRTIAVYKAVLSED
jgi:glycosyltransferase involved in cell wall biosynthesis